VELTAYLALLRRCWAFLLVAALLGGAVAVGLGLRQDDRYSSTASVFLSPGQGQSVGELAQGSSYTEGLVQSYVRLVTTPAVLTPVIDQLGLDTSAKALAGSITAEAQLETVVIDITAVSGSADRSAAIANAVGTQLGRTTEDLSPTSARGTTAINVVLVAPATPSASPSSPDRKLNLVIGAALGLLLGVAAVVSRDVLDTRVRDEDDLRDLTEVGVLASLAGPTPSPHGEGPASRLESMRRLKANLGFLRSAGRSQQLIITSASDAGTTVLALELARVMAGAETRVLLVEADLRTPSMARTAGVASSPGLVSVLDDGLALSRATQRAGADGCDVLVAGAVASNPDELLGSAAMDRCLEDLRTVYDVVLLVSPPVRSVADTAILAAKVDGTVIVVDGGRTTRQQLRDSLRDLRSARAPVIGVVIDHGPVNGRHRSLPRASAASPSPDDRLVWTGGHGDDARDRKAM